MLITGFLFQIDEQTRTMYEQTMKEWQGCEAIVRQREREKHAEALARCSSGASVERGPVQRDSTISTDASLTFLPQNVLHYVTIITTETDERETVYCILRTFLSKLADNSAFCLLSDALPLSSRL